MSTLIVLGVDTSFQNAFHHLFDNLIVESTFFLHDIFPWIYMVFVHFSPFKIDEMFESFINFIIVASGLKGIDTL